MRMPMSRVPMPGMSVPGMSAVAPMPHAMRHATESHGDEAGGAGGEGNSVEIHVQRVSSRAAARQATGDRTTPPLDHGCTLAILMSLRMPHWKDPVGRRQAPGVSWNSLFSRSCVIFRCSSAAIFSSIADLFPRRARVMASSSSESFPAAQMMQIYPNRCS